MRCAPLLALASGCIATACTSERVTLEAPPVWLSAIVSVERAGGVAAAAYAASGPIEVEVEADSDIEVLAIFYDRPLVQLYMAEGPIALDTGVRPIPSTSLEITARAFVDGAPQPAETVSAVDARVQRLRLPPLRGADCEAVGQCFALRALEGTCSDECALPRIEEPPAPEPPAPPRPPAPPETQRWSASCPSGWRATDDGCRPPALVPRVACPAGQVQHFGATACTPIGAPCPAGLWPTALPSGRPVAFVDPLGRADPNGVPALTSIASAPADAVVALSRAVHVGGGVRLRGDRVVIGACALETIIDSVGEATTLVGGGLLRDLTVRGPRRIGVAIDVEPAARLELRGVIIERQGVVVHGQLDAEDILVRDVGGFDGTGERRAIWSRDGGAAEARRAAFEHRGAQSVIADGPGARVVLREVVVTSTDAASLLATAGGTLEAYGALLLGTRALATIGGHLGLEDVTVAEGTTPQGNAIAVADASLTGRRVVIARPSRSAITAVDGARLTLEDLWVEDSGARDEGALVDIGRAATATLARVHLRAFDRAGLDVHGPGARVSIEDATWRGGRSNGADEADGGGVVVRDGAGLDAARIAIREVRGFGISVDNAATATITDVVVDDVARSGDDQRGRGVAVLGRGRLTGTRVRLLASKGTHALAQSPGTRLILRDLEIRGDLAERGLGVVVTAGAHLLLERARVEQVADAALRLSDGATAEVRDLSARDMRPRDGTAARGVDLEAGTRLMLERVALDDVDGRAVSIATSATATITDLDASAIHRLGSVEGEGLVVGSMEPAGGPVGGPVGQAFVERARIRGAESGSVLVAGAKLHLVDALLDNTSLTGTVDPAPAIGLSIRRTGHVRGDRVAIVGMLGRGVALTSSASVELRKLRIESTGDTGVRATDGSRVLLEDAVLRNLVGAGLDVKDLAVITGARVSVLGVTRTVGELGWAAAVGDAGDLFLTDAILGDAEDAALSVTGDVSLVRIAPYVNIRRAALLRSAYGVWSNIETSEGPSIELDQVILIGNDVDVVSPAGN